MWWSVINVFYPYKARLTLKGSKMPPTTTAGPAAPLGRRETRLWPADPRAYGGRKARRAGRYEVFIPDPIHGRDFALDGEAVAAIAEATRALRTSRPLTSARGHARCPRAQPSPVRERGLIADRGRQHLPQASCSRRLPGGQGATRSPRCGSTRQCRSDGKSRRTRHRHQATQSC